MSNDEPEIEVTAEMVEAGASAFHSSSSNWWTEIAADIYRAMEACRREGEKTANQREVEANKSEFKALIRGHVTGLYRDKYGTSKPG